MATNGGLIRAGNRVVHPLPLLTKEKVRSEGKVRVLL